MDDQQKNQHTRISDKPWSVPYFLFSKPWSVPYFHAMYAYRYVIDWMLIIHSHITMMHCLGAVMQVTGQEWGKDFHLKVKIPVLKK